MDSVLGDILREETRNATQTALNGKKRCGFYIPGHQRQESLYIRALSKLNAMNARKYCKKRTYVCMQENWPYYQCMQS